MVCIPVDAESGDPHPFAEKFAIASIIETLPVSEPVESNGEDRDFELVRLHHCARSISQSETDLNKRAINITEADELLAGISSNIAMGPAMPDAGSRMNEPPPILASPYQSPSPKAKRPRRATSHGFWTAPKPFPSAPILPSDSGDFASLAAHRTLVIATSG